MMDNIVTLNQLFNIEDTIISINKEQSLENQYLSEHICGQYDVIPIKKKLLKIFNEFKSAKYLFSFPIEENTHLTSNYEKVVSQHVGNNVSQVENAITKYVDKQLRTTNIYNSILVVANKLTEEEVVYFINTFFTHKSEEEIAYQIGMSKTALQKYKKSCIVKTWIEMERYYKQD